MVKIYDNFHFEYIVLLNIKCDGKVLYEIRIFFSGLIWKLLVEIDGQKRTQLEEDILVKDLRNRSLSSSCTILNSEKLMMNKNTGCVFSLYYESWS